MALAVSVVALSESELRGNLQLAASHLPCFRTAFADPGTQTGLTTRSD